MKSRRKMIKLKNKEEEEENGGKDKYERKENGIREG